MVLEIWCTPDTNNYDASTLLQRVTAITSDTSLTVADASAKSSYLVKRLVMLTLTQLQQQLHLDLTLQFILRMTVEYCNCIQSHLDKVLCMDFKNG